MELKQLIYFQSVARVGNVSKAAEQLHIAQPALSLSIQKLERELELSLFDRSHKPLALTAEGKIFLKRTDALLALYDDMVAEMRDYHHVLKGNIRIGIPPMLGAYLFPIIFSEFYKAYPNVSLTVVEEGTIELKRRLRQDELDVGVIMMETDNTSLETLPITSYEIKVCVPKAHRLAQFQTVTFEALKQEAFILLNDQTFMRRKILNLCEMAGYKPHIVFSSNQISTLLGLVSQGTGIAFILGSLAEAHEDIATLSLEPTLKVDAALAWRAEGYLSKATQTFIDFIQTFSNRFV